MEVGQTATFSKTITEFDVYAFAGITGDFNSVHINQLEAAKSKFGDRIAHGILVGGMISTVLGTKLPGEGTVYLEQLFKFLKPVYFGDTLTAKVTICEILNRDKGIYKFDTSIDNQKNETVLSGYAIVMAKREDELL